MIYGARTSLIIGILATALSIVLGVAAGLAAGYYRGATDSILSRVMDMLLSFPTLLFSLALLSIFHDVPSFLGLSGTPLRFAVIVFVLGFFSFPYIGRIVRGQVLSLREKEFVEAARSLGASNYRIMTREIMPNLVGPILVYSTLAIPNNILGEAGLSYLGVGVPVGTASWGHMLSDAGPVLRDRPVLPLRSRAHPVPHRSRVQPARRRTAGRARPEIVPVNSGLHRPRARTTGTSELARVPANCRRGP